MVSMLVEAVHNARPVSIGDPDVAFPAEALFVHGAAARTVRSHRTGREGRILRGDRQLGADLTVEAHLHHSGGPDFALHALTEHRRPVGVAVVGAAAEYESRVADPEAFIITLAHESDAVAFGEPCLGHSEQMAPGVERDELPAMKTDDLAAVGGDDSVVHPTGGSAG